MPFSRSSRLDDTSRARSRQVQDGCVGGWCLLFACLTALGLALPVFAGFNRTTLQWAGNSDETPYVSGSLTAFGNSEFGYHLRLALNSTATEPLTLNAQVELDVYGGHWRDRPEDWEFSREIVLAPGANTQIELPTLGVFSQVSIRVSVDRRLENGRIIRLLEARDRSGQSTGEDGSNGHLLVSWEKDAYNSSLGPLPASMHLYCGINSILVRPEASRNNDRLLTSLDIDVIRRAADAGSSVLLELVDGKSSEVADEVLGAFDLDRSTIKNDIERYLLLAASTASVPLKLSSGALQLPDGRRVLHPPQVSDQQAKLIVGGPGSTVSKRPALITYPAGLGVLTVALLPEADAGIGEHLITSGALSQFNNYPLEMLKDDSLYTVALEPMRISPFYLLIVLLIYVVIAGPLLFIWTRRRWPTMQLPVAVLASLVACVVIYLGVSISLGSPPDRSELLISMYDMEGQHRLTTSISMMNNGEDRSLPADESTWLYIKDVGVSTHQPINVSESGANPVLRPRSDGMPSSVVALASGRIGQRLAVEIVGKMARNTGEVPFIGGVVSLSTESGRSLVELPPLGPGESAELRHFDQWAEYPIPQALPHTSMSVYELLRRIRPNTQPFAIVVPEGPPPPSPIAQADGETVYRQWLAITHPIVSGTFELNQWLEKPPVRTR